MNDAVRSERPALELADVIRSHGEAFLNKHGSRLRPEQKKALYALAACRTAAPGGHVEECLDCGQAADRRAVRQPEVFDGTLPQRGHDAISTRAWPLGAESPQATVEKRQEAAPPFRTTQPPLQPSIFTLAVDLETKMLPAAGPRFTSSTIRISCRGRLQDLHAARNQDGGPGQLHPLVSTCVAGHLEWHRHILRAPGNFRPDFAIAYARI